MTSPFTDFAILPSYAKGFTYTWRISGEFNDFGPWEFTVQEGPAPNGPWKTISPVLKDVFSWREDSRDPVNKSNVLYFRVTLKTPNGTYASPVVQPYGRLKRRDFLVSREVMRQFYLHSKGMAGVECQVYLVSTFGPKCPKCIDPITGMIRDSHCKHCYGTGRAPAYHGPYPMWFNFSEDNQHITDTEKHGTVEKKSFQAQALGNPVLKHGAVVIVPPSDKRYFVSAAAMTTEMRRIPLIQTLALEEAPQTDKIYSL